MKKIILLALCGLSLLSSSVDAQVKKVTPTQTFTKQKMDTLYVFKDDIAIKNGKGDKVIKRFTLAVPVDVWDRLIKSDSNFTSTNESKVGKIMDKHYMYLIVNIISIHAHYQCKNTLSFEPLNDNFIAWSGNTFLCNYKCMARNGYGNLIETTIVSEYIPNSQD